MRLWTTESLTQGMRLGKSIRNERGQILINEGIELNEKLIRRLKELGIPFVYIQDPRTEHIKPGKNITETLRREAISTIENTFTDLQKNDSLSSSFVIEKAYRRFSGLIRHIMNDIRSNDELLTLLADVYTYDNYIFTHSLNVTLYSLAIGMELKLSSKQLETLGLGAILHDVGKMLVPVEILMKPGRLTKEEFEEIKKHSETGFHLIRNVQTLPLLVAHCAYQHHERIDGSGYPRGLTGDDIHFFGKIIAVADVFDAVTSNRVYRSAMLPHEGLEILYAGSGVQFEMKVVEAFRRAVAVYPNGLGVTLNDGRKGIVSRQNVGCSDRPVIEILEENGEQLEAPYELDLNNHNHLVIAGCDTAQAKINN
ncbi:HD-GYP domain-containing protein [Peribacillus glennii]|uniref:HD-GYP domain-containing protein n=1 Tax=Peribacillus glennii TaxID=2303991 RepID=A0A372LCR3_9BACI|nr:HD domain-containing phosphohydrolase [Peribacillus glennii]RFU63795.1 HD-GYP domain-containing protein [Peribacillus glennii]